MGGDLALPASASGDAAPRFALWALRDPGSESMAGNQLERMQIIKGWTENGELHERVYDVAGSDTGASVDLSSCEPEGKGADQLCAVWRDPDFDSESPAFYYARVLENPSCRWSQYVCNAAGVDCSDPDSVPEGLVACCSAEHHPVIRERAWTSPIWYTPAR